MRRSTRSTAAPLVATVSLLSAILVLGSPAALAARLVGGAEQAAIRRAFDTSASHRRRLIASIRVSTVDSAWAVVRSVAPQTAGSARALTLTSAYYHRVGGSERPGSPPATVRADLTRTFRIAVVYTASGTESITYAQRYRSDCAGQGGFTESEIAQVRPMSWTVRYVVDLDDVLAAAGSAQGSALVPAISFAAAGSRLSAVERLVHTVQDAGCNAPPKTFRCAKTFHLGGADPAGQLSSTAAGGLEVGVPFRTTSTGVCAPEDYVLGPSLWDSGAGIANATALGLLGGRLPGRPYAPVRVSWPGNSGAQSQPFAASPCQGDAAVCQDAFQWRGTVRLEPVA
ncbi:MAG TPA: hypothetical protein VGI07_14165 [Solirubrobacteraceae bacterium]